MPYSPKYNISWYRENIRGMLWGLYITYIIMCNGHVNYLLDVGGIYYVISIRCRNYAFLYPNAKCLPVLIKICSSGEYAINSKNNIFLIRFGL